MTTSTNGWPVLPTGSDEAKALLRTGTIPGTRIRFTAHRDALPVLLYIAARVHAECAPLEIGNDHPTGQDEGGYNYRAVRGSKFWSTHASGTGIDLNWRLWPMGRQAMTPTQRAAALRIAADCAEVVTWGGVFTRIDEMHWEIKSGVTAEQLARFRARRRIADDGTITPVAAPAPAPAPAPKPAAKPAQRPTLRLGATGADVKALQALLVKGSAKLAVDGTFGPKTEAAVKDFQRKRKLAADGIVGPRTWAALEGK
jgi:hypothetical protein